MYFFGATELPLVKIGSTANSDLAVRRRGVQRDHIGGIPLVLLAALIGSGTHERAIQKYFAAHSVEGETEWFHATDEVVEYINWLRQQWWVTLTESDVIQEPMTFDTWCPTPERRIRVPEPDPTYLIQPDQDFHGDLAGTRWDRLSTPLPVGEDYYTPAEIVDAAREAMGGIDLDPASNWRANRVHRIPTYYHIHRNAFAPENRWAGRVWLNPPYDKWKPWFDRIIYFWDLREIEQICVIGPVWAFNTQQAKPLIKRASAMILLSPTPKFWGQPNGKTGTNHPHAILYLGNRVNAFREAFRPFGIPMELFVDDVRCCTQAEVVAGAIVCPVHDEEAIRAG